METPKGDPAPGDEHPEPEHSELGAPEVLGYALMGVGTIDRSSVPPHPQEGQKQVEPLNEEPAQS